MGKQTLRYYIDGYNLFFHLDLSSANRSQERHELLITFLEKHLKNRHPPITLIFDNHSPLAGEKPLEQPIENSLITLCFSPKGLCADRYIIERLQAKKGEKITVVTSDKKLSQSVQQLGFATQSSPDFLKKMTCQKTPSKRKPNNSSPTEKTRLQRIFEEKLDKAKQKVSPSLEDDLFL